MVLENLTRSDQPHQEEGRADHNNGMGEPFHVARFCFQHLSFNPDNNRMILHSSEEESEAQGEMNLFDLNVSSVVQDKICTQVV